MRILIVDNQDSFVYNIVGLLRKLRKQEFFAGLEWDVEPNDRVDPAVAASYDAVILSPGPGLPCEAGRLCSVISECAGRVPLFGVCLGFQAIAEHFGGRLCRLPSPRHGHRSRLCRVDPRDPAVGFLAGGSTSVGRYHSWVVDPSSLPEDLVATSYDEEGHIMSLRHRRLPVFGTQFHPESVISDCGERIMGAFLRFSPESTVAEAEKNS